VVSKYEEKLRTQGIQLEDGSYKAGTDGIDALRQL